LAPIHLAIVTKPDDTVGIAPSVALRRPGGAARRSATNLSVVWHVIRNAARRYEIVAPVPNIGP